MFSSLKDNDAYYLDLFSTNNAFIGLGIGGEVLKFSIKYLFLKDNKFSKIVVDPFSSAEGFYEKIRFEKNSDEKTKNSFSYVLFKKNIFK